MRIAYLFTVHKNPQLLKRTVEALSTGNSRFFIHVDKKSKMEQFAGITSRDVEFVKERVAVYWSEYTQVEATLRLMRQAMASPLQFEYFVFLQGSDYPLRSGAYIEQFFEEHRGTEFLNIVKMPAPGYAMWKINKVRYPSDRPRLKRASQILGKLGLANRDYRKSLRGMEAYAGLAHWALTREACAHILGYVDRHAEVERYFRNTYTADEMMFHTILGNSPFLGRIERALTYVEHTWAVKDETRHMIGEKHVEFFESMDAVRVNDEWGAQEMLFARKFSDERLDLVDRIDEMIRKKEHIVATPLAMESRRAIAHYAGRG